MTTTALPRPPGRVLYFNRLATILSPGDLVGVEDAYQLSKYGHARQKRDDGSRYFDHPKEVNWIYVDELGGRSARLMICNLLHDIIEDQYLLTYDRIRRFLGQDTAEDVLAITKLKDEPTREYLQRTIDQGPYTIVSKLCDRVHNNRSLFGVDPEKVERTRKSTREYHLPMLIPALKRHGGLWAKDAVKLEELMEEALARPY
jgi:GTP diphosphokinase / guanosine-3',5'-bis(diphosphate) 3'-diphosphatase